MKSRLAVIAFLIGTLLSVARAATAPELFAQANDAFAKATASRTTTVDQSRVQYAQSIALYEQLITEYHIANPDLYYNLANAYALSGDVGRAVLNYKRAAKLAPGDADIESNLRATRARVGVAVDTQGSGQVARELLSWHRAIPQQTRLMIWLVAFAGIWLTLAVRLSPPARRWARPWVVVLFAMVAVLAGVSLWSEQHSLRDHPEAVIVADSVVGRKGPDDKGYEPSFTRPLSAGVEITVIERRAGWALVRLADARETWLPAGSWEEI